MLEDGKFNGLADSWIPFARDMLLSINTNFADSLDPTSSALRGESALC